MSKTVIFDDSVVTMAIGVEFSWFVLRVVFSKFLSLVFAEVVFVKDFVVVVGSVTNVTVDDTSTPKTFVAFISGTLVARLDSDCCDGDVVVIIGLVVVVMTTVGSTKILLDSFVLFSFFSVGFGLVGLSGGLRLIGAGVVVVVVVRVVIVVVVRSVVGTNCSGIGTPDTNGFIICLVSIGFSNGYGGGS